MFQNAGNWRSANAKNLGNSHFHSNAYTYNQNENNFCNCHSGLELLGMNSPLLFCLSGFVRGKSI